MSRCSIDLKTAGSEIPEFCERCDGIQCEVWRTELAPRGEPKIVNTPGTGQSPMFETRPDPAYTAALSESAILIDARARAFELAIKLAGQSDQAEEFQFPDLINVSNRILAYLTDGK